MLQTLFPPSQERTFLARRWRPKWRLHLRDMGRTCMHFARSLCRRSHRRFIATVMGVSHVGTVSSSRDGLLLLRSHRLGPLLAVYLHGLPGYRVDSAALPHREMASVERSQRLRSVDVASSRCYVRRQGCHSDSQTR